MPCPTPKRNRLGDLECQACGRTWEPWDEAPSCLGNPRDRTRVVADRELGKIRRILRVETASSTLDHSTIR